MAEQLADKQARRKAQARFKKRAEEELVSFRTDVLKANVQGFTPDIYMKSWEKELKNIKNLFEHSDAGAARFLAIADELTSLAKEIGKKVQQCRQTPIEELLRLSMYSQKFDSLFMALQDGSEAFLKMAARPRIIGQ